MLLIDTYNVLHTTGVLPPRLAGLELPGLINLIRLSRYAPQPLRLVCDGRRPPTDKAAARRDGRERTTLGHADVWFAGAGREADELIEHILATDSAARRFLVVSSDRRVQRAAAAARAAFLSSQTFLAHLIHDEARPRHSPLPEFATAIPLDAYSVAHWMNEFRLGVGDWMKLKSSPDQTAPRVARLSEPRPQDPDPRVPPLSEPPATPIHEPTPRSDERPQAPEPQRATPPADLQLRAGQPPLTPPQPAGPAPPPPEPWMRDALNLWGDRLHLDDLDMRRWLEP